RAACEDVSRHKQELELSRSVAGIGFVGRCARTVVDFACRGGVRVADSVRECWEFIFVARMGEAARVGDSFDAGSDARASGAAVAGGKFTDGVDWRRLRTGAGDLGSGCS